jgi:hypothetical protein
VLLNTITLTLCPELGQAQKYMLKIVLRSKLLILEHQHTAIWQNLKKQLLLLLLNIIKKLIQFGMSLSMG